MFAWYLQNLLNTRMQDIASEISEFPLYMQIFTLSLLSDDNLSVAKPFPPGGFKID